MPRLDNSSEDVVEYFKLDFNPEDPGATEPIDVCQDCFEGDLDELPTCEHPPYDEQWPRYTCYWCGAKLEDYDD